MKMERILRRAKKMGMAIFLAMPIVLIIRLIRPLIVVRLGRIDIARIGGVYLADWYLSERHAGLHRGQNVDLFYFTAPTSNAQWSKMWASVLTVLPGYHLWELVFKLNHWLPGFEKYETPSIRPYPNLADWKRYIEDEQYEGVKKHNDRLAYILKNKSPNIAFTPEEETKGREVIQSIGIPEDKKYICFHARDSAYLDAVFPGWDWNYHNYRDSSIENYLLAAEEMVGRGFYSVRMGSVVKERLNTRCPQIIDYATSGKRSDFADIYIGSHCRFFLCSDGGMSVIPEMFRVPAVYVNWTLIPRISTWVLNGIFIFKKFYLRKENRMMKFSEIMNLDFGAVDTNKIFDDMGIELIENTPEEIKAATIEMDERLNGTWVSTDEDEYLQARFWKLFGPEKMRSPELRIGADYLRQNEDLIN